MSVDPTQDFYEMFDRAGLSAAYLQGTRAPFAVNVSNVRTKLVQELKAYLEARDKAPKHIEVTEVTDEPEQPMA